MQSIVFFFWSFSFCSPKSFTKNISDIVAASTIDYRPPSGRYLPPTPVSASSSNRKTPPWRSRSERGSLSSQDEQISCREQDVNVTKVEDGSRKSSIKSNKSDNVLQNVIKEDENYLEKDISRDVEGKKDVEYETVVDNNDVTVDQRENVVGDVHFDKNVDETESHEGPSGLSLKKRESENSYLERPVSVGSRGSRATTPDRASLRSELSEKTVQFMEDGTNDNDLIEKGEDIGLGEKLLKKRPTSSRLSLETTDIIIETEDGQLELTEENSNTKNVSKIR